MLTQEKIDEVKRLLAEGKHYRPIHRLTGVSRFTIGQIAHGRYKYRRPLNVGTESIRFADGPKKHCPVCGHKVAMPCRICRDRKARAAGQRLTFQLADKDFRTELKPADLELHLPPEIMARVAEVRERKRAEGEAVDESFERCV